VEIPTTLGEKVAYFFEILFPFVGFEFVADVVQQFFAFVGLKD
jgi:hypothetical protein